MTDSKRDSIWTSNLSEQRRSKTAFFRQAGVIMNNYYTIADKAEASFTEKRSEFIGYIAPVTTNDEAVRFIESIREKHRKATHNVYAYILRNDNISRYSDDGEPQGTAGIPVFDVLRKRNLTDVCIVVTRYFGGILLGGGGLVRAYSHCASIACDSAEIMNMCHCTRINISVDYSVYGKISYIIPRYEVITVSSDFGDKINLELLVTDESRENLFKELVNISNGNITIEYKEELFEDFSSVKNKNSS